MNSFLMSVTLESTKSDFTDNFNELSYLVAKPTAYQEEANQKRDWGCEDQHNDSSEK